MSTGDLTKAYAVAIYNWDAQKDKPDTSLEKHEAYVRLQNIKDLLVKAYLEHVGGVK